MSLFLFETLFRRTVTQVFLVCLTFRFEGVDFNLLQLIGWLVSYVFKCEWNCQWIKVNWPLQWKVLFWRLLANQYLLLRTIWRLDLWQTARFKMLLRFFLPVLWLQIKRLTLLDKLRGRKRLFKWFINFWWPDILYFQVWFTLFLSL